MANLVSYNPLLVLNCNDPSTQQALNALVTQLNQQLAQISRVINSQLSLAGTAANLPASGTFPGQHYYETDTNTDKIWNGSAWH